MKVLGADWPLRPPPCTLRHLPVHSPQSLQGRALRSPRSPNPGLQLGLLWLEPCSPDSPGRLFSAHACWLSSGTLTTGSTLTPVLALSVNISWPCFIQLYFKLSCKYTYKSVRLHTFIEHVCFYSRDGCRMLHVLRAAHTGHVRQRHNA